MLTDRRGLLARTAALTAAAMAITSIANAASTPTAPTGEIDLSGLDSTGESDQTAALQLAIERSAASGCILRLPAGNYHCKTLGLPGGARIVGVPGATRLLFQGNNAFIVASHADNIWLEGLVIDGNTRPLDAVATDGLLTFSDCAGLTLRNIAVSGALLNGVSMRRCSGTVENCTITACEASALFSLDAEGLAITGNAISDMGNNGIQVWRTVAGEDGTLVANNRISQIAARAGGDGPNGNGINIFRSGSVQVLGNRITDCAFSAIRANAASNCQIIGNSAERMGEVALYAEFAFEGAVIANNLVDRASVGISVTNFNEGGRLAVVQGNLIRNLHRQSASGEDQGIGISVEADASVTGNVVEGAAQIGIQAGWGEYRRDIVLSGNVVRQSPIGIAVSSDAKGGAVLVAQNLISGATGGSIRQMDHATVLDPDLAREPAGAHAGITLSGNVSV